MNKTVKTVLITIVVMIAICGCLAIGALFGPGLIRTIQMKPAYKIADMFMNDIQSGDLENAFTLVSDDIRQNAGSAEALPVYLGILKPIESFDRGISIINNNKVEISVAYGAVFSDQTEASIWLNLVKSEDIWKISSVSVREK